jgi:hypothetical protein
MDKSDGAPRIEYKDMSIDDLFAEYIDANENLHGWRTMPSSLGVDTKQQQIQAGLAELAEIQTAIFNAMVKQVSKGILSQGQKVTERGIEATTKIPEGIPSGEYDLVPHRG